MQLPQLLFRHWRRRIHHQVLAALGLRERDHVANRFRFAHHGDDAIEAEGDPRVRRRTELQRVEQEAELRALVFFTDAQRGELFGLKLGAMDANRAATELPAVHRHVVGLGEHLGRVGVQQRPMLVLRAGERVMRGDVAVVLFVVLVAREVHHPARLEALFEEAELGAVLVADLRAQRADGVVDDLFAIGTEEEDVTVLRAAALDDRLQRIGRQELDDRALQAFVVQLRHVVDLDPGQTLRAVDGDEGGVVVDFLARELGATRYAQRDDAAILQVGRTAEDLEVDRLHDVGQLGEFELDAQIGFVAAVLAHRFGIRDAREIGQIDAETLLPQVFDQPLHHVLHVVLGHERGFDVDLRELGLAVGAQILVAEALDDLVVAIETGHHQELLEQLRRLRQRVELAVVDARGHQELARTLGSALVQERCFDIDEAALVQILARGGRHPGAQHKVPGHLRTAQVEIAVFQAHLFVDVVLIHHEWWRVRGVVDLDLVSKDFNAAGDHVAVLGAGGTRAHLAGDADAVFVAQRFGQLEGVRAIRVDHDLGDALAITQVDKDDAAVVAATVHPAGEGHDLFEVFLVDETGVGSTHGFSRCQFHCGRPDRRQSARHRGRARGMRTTMARHGIGSAILPRPQALAVLAAGSCDAGAADLVTRWYCRSGWAPLARKRPLREAGGPWKHCRAVQQRPSK